MEKNRASKNATLKERWVTRLGLTRKQDGSKEPMANAAIYRKLPVTTEASKERQRLNQEERERLKDEAIEALPDGYFLQAFDPPLYELQGMPASFQASDLDGTVEDRANVLEVVSERLSKHVLANYDVFVQGINEAASVENDLQGALGLLKGTRQRLASSQAEIKEHMAIASQQRQKEALVKMEATLLQLKQAAALRDKLRDAHEEGDFAGSFLLCAETCRLLESLQKLSATGELFASVNRLYADIVSRLEATLSSTCAEFEEVQYCKVLEGYSYLGNTAGLGEEVNNCFVSIITSSALKVVRGVVLTRSGLEDKARSTTILQELVKWLPANLYRQCLARVLMVVFDILASHHRMLQWHESALQSLLSESPEPRNGVSSKEQVEASTSENSTSANGNIEHQNDSNLAIQHNAGDHHLSGAESCAEESREGAAMPLDRRKSGSTTIEDVGRASVGPSSTSSATKAAVKSLRSFSSQPRLQASGSEAERDPLSDAQEPAALAQQLGDGAVWSEALVSVAESMTSGRRWVWDEAARKVATLLAAPAAFQGEHFLQTLEWTQSMAQIGEAFSQSKTSSLRESMHRHSGRFFQAYHASNLQVLQTMLEQELWKRLPTPPGQRPNLRAALEVAHFGKHSQSLGTASFAEWVAAGNPWKRHETELRPASLVADDGSDSDEAQASPQRQPAFKDPLTNGGSIPESPKLAEELVVTTASWRMLQWMSQYADLMRLLSSDSGKIYSACCELFELYFLHVFHCFSGISIADVLKGQAGQGGPDAVPVRLQTAVKRIVTQSLPRARPIYVADAHSNGTSQVPRQAPQDPPQASSPNRSTVCSPLPPALSNPGNMYGLQERRVAVDSMLAIAKQLQEAHAAMSRKLENSLNVPEHHLLENFMQTVKAAFDLGEVVLRAAARLNLPITWIPNRLAEQNFDMAEPPTKASPWVGVLLNHLRVFHQRLQLIDTMERQDISKLWQCGLSYAAEMVLEGLARAGARGRCTPMGRSAMSLDLQGLQRGLQGLSAATSDAAATALRVVDAYIKAYYIPWGAELHRWAMTHPEYTQDQTFALVNCIAESNNMRRRDRAMLINEIERDLNMLQ